MSTASLSVLLSPDIALGNSRLEEGVYQMELSDEARLRCRSGADGACAQAGLQRRTAHIQDRTGGVLQIALVAVITHAGLNRGQPQDVGRL